jgi:hypothetical protein
MALARRFVGFAASWFMSGFLFLVAGFARRANLGRAGIFTTRRYQKSVAFKS